MSNGEIVTTYSEDGLWRFDSWVEEDRIAIKMATTPEFEDLLASRFAELKRMIEANTLPEWLSEEIKDFLAKRVELERSR